MKKAIYFFALPLLLIACGKNSELLVRENLNDFTDMNSVEAFLKISTWNEQSYNQSLPKYLQLAGMNMPAVNNTKATIGRILFYDENLSLDRSISCASCHKQKHAFADNVALSTGVNGLKGPRNSMPIANVANFAAHHSAIEGVQPLLLWDNRAVSIEEQSRLAFQSSHEMGMSMAGVVERVKELPYYSYFWKQAYGDNVVTEDKVLECLSTFVGAIGSHKSRFDNAMENATDITNLAQFDTTIGVVIRQIYYGNNDTTIGTTVTMTGGLPGLSMSENRGRNIFIQNCTKCHSPIRSFQEVFEACNGLDMDYADKGIGALTGNPTQNGVFKSPSLRNIVNTAPYMHDGRFKTLSEVVEFYSTGVQNHPNLHPELKRSGSTKLNLTQQQKQDLVAYLATLTDSSIATEERFSNPF